MTQQDMAQKLSEIDPEWGDAYAEEELEFFPESGDSLSNNINWTLTWVTSKKGVTFWSYVYNRLQEMGK